MPSRYVSFADFGVPERGSAVRVVNSVSEFVFGVIVLEI